MANQWLTNTSSFIFDASAYVRAGCEKSDGEFNQEDRELFSTIRNQLPELSQWGDLPLGVALADYFQQVYLVSWSALSGQELERDNLIHFLAFLHYQQTVGEWPWGDDIDKLNELAREGTMPSPSNSSEQITPLKTSIGDVEGFWDAQRLIVVNGPNRNLARFVRTDSMSPLYTCLTNFNNHLFVYEPHEFKGEWECVGQDINRGDALTPYPFIFQKVECDH